MAGLSKRTHCRECGKDEVRPKSAMCRECDNARRRQNRLDNLDRQEANSAKWYQENKAHCREYKK